MPKSPSSIVPISIRLPRILLTQIDDWAASQEAPTTRSDALQCLLEAGLSSIATATNGRQSHEGSQQAAGMAGKAIDGLGDKSATAADREHRKVGLVEGPTEFREMRVDNSAAKPKA